MTVSRTKQERAEHHARVLAEAARKMGRLSCGLHQSSHAVEFSPEIVTLLALLHEKDELDQLPQIVDAYRKIVTNDDVTAYVSVTTAVEMGDELREQVRTHMEKKLGKKVYLVEQVDPAIVGGIVIETQGERYDASVAAQLVHIHKRLASVYLGSDDE